MLLVVHGYSIRPDGKLGTLSEVVCQKVVKIHYQYTHIILVCGWGWDIGEKPPPPRPTVGEGMYTRLTELGVPKNKLYTQYTLECGDYIPPRDTMEEIDILPKLFEKLGVNPQKAAFEAIAFWAHTKRIELIYKSRKARCPVISIGGL